MVVLRESWWPTAGGAGASLRNQTQYFRGLSLSPVAFVYGEAYDQFWKTAEGPQGPHWGFHTAAGVAKPVVGKLKALYQGSR